MNQTCKREKRERRRPWIVAGVFFIILPAAYALIIFCSYQTGWPTLTWSKTPFYHSSDKTYEICLWQIKASWKMYGRKLFFTEKGHLYCIGGFIISDEQLNARYAYGMCVGEPLFQGRDLKLDNKQVATFNAWKMLSLSYEFGLDPIFLSGDERHHGRWIWWHTNGKKKTVMNFFHGLAVGKLKSWHKNGQINIEANYKKGRLHGQMTGWYADGQKKLEEFYKNGLESGKFFKWHKNGKKGAEGLYANGKPNGKWTMWNENGKFIYGMNYDKEKHAGASVSDKPGNGK